MRMERVTKKELENLKEKVLELGTTDPKRAAAHAYALAVHYKKRGESQYMVTYAKKAVELLEKLSSEKLVGCAMNEKSCIEGVTIPPILSARMIKTKFKI